MPGVANGLVPQQGQKGMTRSPRLPTVPGFACPQPLLHRLHWQSEPLVGGGVPGWVQLRGSDQILGRQRKQSCCRSLVLTLLCA